MKEKKSQSIRVLHITEMLSAAGIESFIMNNYRRIDRTKVKFDFFVLRNEHEFYDDEVKQLGGVKYWTHAKEKNAFIRVMDESYQIYKFLKKHHYDIVHIHYTTPLRAPYLLAAKLAGVKTRIYHSHSAYVFGKSAMKKIIYSLMRCGISKWGTHFFACSNAAAEWMFKRKILDENKAKVIYNGIDVQKFKYDQQTRKAVRNEYGIENKFVLIHTGRFLEQKNHTFIIDVFKCLKEKRPEAYLMLLGTGELIDIIKDKVHEKELDQDVCFLGVKSDVNRYLCAADCYIMPSFYEGLPVAAVEAECSGLPCVFSTNVTKEVALTENVTFLALDEMPEKWCDVILSYRKVLRNDVSEKVKEHGYDIQDVANGMQKFYENAVQ